MYNILKHCLCTLLTHTHSLRHRSLSQKNYAILTMSRKTYLGDGDGGVGVGIRVGSTIVGIEGVTSPAGATC